MACHEIAALRLALMDLLGREDDAERQHELAELGDAGSEPGPIRSLCEARDLASIKRLFESSVAELEQRVASTPHDHEKRAYLQTLVVLTKKVELEIEGQVAALDRLYRDLEQIHDFVHEIYPAR